MDETSRQFSLIFLSLRDVTSDKQHNSKVQSNIQSLSSYSVHWSICIFSSHYTSSLSKLSMERYAMGEQIGEGTFGNVCLAVKNDTNEKVNPS